MLKFVLRRRVLLQQELAYRPGAKLWRLNAVTEGVIPPDEIPGEIEPVGIDPAVLDLSTKMGSFTGNLVPLPDSASPAYASAQETNAEAIWVYARGQVDVLKRAGVRGLTGDLKIIFNHSSYCKSDTPTYSEALVNCKKSFARGGWKHFWAAVSVKTQKKRDMIQQIPAELGVTEAEYSEIQDNLSYTSKGFAYSSRTTQSKRYIETISPAQKKRDSEAFQAWYNTKVSNFVKILRLNVSDIPFGYCPNEILAFDKDPTSRTARAALIGKLRSLQKDAILHHRAQVLAGNPNWDFFSWLEAK